MIAQQRHASLTTLLLALWVGANALGTQALAAPARSPYVSEVITLKYALASEVGPVLSRMATNRTPPATAESPGPALWLSPAAASPRDIFSNTWSHSSLSLQSLLHRAAASGQILRSGQSPIVVDERTNSLLLYADRDQLQQFKETISRLDIPKIQVLIEAAVILVPLGSHKTLDQSYLGQASGSNYYPFGNGPLSRSNLLSVSSFVPCIYTNAAASQVSRFEYLAQLANDLNVTVSALVRDRRNLLHQRPRIQTSSGVTATIFIGESRPYPSGGYYGGGTYGSYASLQALKAGVTLDLTPSVMPDNSIVLKIHQKVEQTSGLASEADARVVVCDRGTVLLGGLVTTVENHARCRVPLLKEIPLVYRMLDRVSTRRERRESLILLHAIILPSVSQT